MPRQRTLTMPQSIRVAKLWFSLLRIHGGNVEWTFWTCEPDLLTQLCEEAEIQDLMDLPIPYVRNAASLRTLLKCVISYLSRGYFEGQLDTWLNNPVIPVVPAEGAGEPPEPGGGLAVERAALLAQTPNCEESSVTAMIIKSKEMILTTDYQETKYRLGEEFVASFNQYNTVNGEIDGIRNRVIRQEVTKVNALAELDNVLEAQSEAFNKLKAFLTKEPGEGAYNGCVFAFGDVFNPGMNQAQLTDMAREATNEEPGLIMRVNPNIHSIRDIPDLNDRYEALLQEYQEINQQRADREDQAQEVSRKARNFMTELLALKTEIEGTEDPDMVVVIIKDYLDQVSDLKKKLSNIRALDDREVPLNQVRVTEVDRDGVTFDALYNVDEWLYKTRRTLLMAKDNQETQNRRKENKEKLVLQ